MNWYLTSFVFGVWHESFLHGLRRQDFVLLLNGSGGCGDDFLLGDNLKGLNYRDVTQSLGDREGCLAILEEFENGPKIIL